MFNKFLLSVFIFLFAIPSLIFAQLNGKVVAISDGDTFILLTNDRKQIRIRLHGIDCPERKQDFGEMAKQFTARMVYGKIVEVKETDLDRYGRIVGIVFVEGRCVNEALLKAGLAWHYTYYDKNPVWKKLEAEARENKVGIWSHEDAVAPWVWRRNR